MNAPPPLIDMTSKPPAPINFAQMVLPTQMQQLISQQNVNKHSISDVYPNHDPNNNNNYNNNTHTVDNDDSETTPKKRKTDAEKPFKCNFPE